MQGGGNTGGSKEDPSVSPNVAASFHWAVMRHMGHRCNPDGGVTNATLHMPPGVHAIHLAAKAPSWLFKQQG